MAEPTVMQSSYDPIIMTSWSTLMTDMRSALTAAGTYPTYTTFEYDYYHGNGAPASTEDEGIGFLENFSGNVDPALAAAWDLAFEGADLPFILTKDEELYTDYKALNSLDGIPDIVADTITWRLNQVDNLIAPNLYQKGIANNCVFSSLYYQALADMYATVNAEGGKLTGDLTTSIHNLAGNRAAEVLRTEAQIETAFMLSKAELAMKRVHLSKTMTLDRMKTILAVNQTLTSERWNHIKQGLALAEGAKRWSLELNKYVVAAQGAMQGIHTLQQSTSGPGALQGTAQTMSYLSTGMNFLSGGLNLYGDMSRIFGWGGKSNG